MKNQHKFIKGHKIQRVRNSVGGVMVSMLASSVVGREFKVLWG